MYQKEEIFIYTLAHEWARTCTHRAKQLLGDCIVGTGGIYLRGVRFFSAELNGLF